MRPHKLHTKLEDKQSHWGRWVVIKRGEIRYTGTWPMASVTVDGLWVPDIFSMLEAYKILFYVLYKWGMLWHITLRHLSRKSASLTEHDCPFFWSDNETSLIHDSFSWLAGRWALNLLLSYLTVLGLIIKASNSFLFWNFYSSNSWPAYLYGSKNIFYSSHLKFSLKDRVFISSSNT